MFLIPLIPLTTGGCTRHTLNSSQAAAVGTSPTFRQLRVGDHWQFRPPSPSRGRRQGLQWEPPTLRYEVISATPFPAAAPAGPAAPAPGTRALTIRVTHQYWGGLPGYPRSWQIRSSDFPVRQGADGSMAWDDLQPEHWSTLDPIMRQFPPTLRCPLTPGQTYNTGLVPLPRGTRQTTWRVVGQETVIVPMGRFLAWRVDSTVTLRSEEGKVKMRNVSTDWYDGNLWLLRRQMRLAGSDVPLLQATRGLLDQSMEQIPWEKTAS